MKRGPDDVENLPDQVKPKRAAPITYDDFIDACENGNLEEVEEGINSLSPDIIASNENDALCAAAENGHLAIVNRLLEIDEVREDATADNNNALSLAAANGHLAIVNRLLEIDEVREDATADGYNVLNLAARNGHLPVVNRLLEIDVARDRATAENHRVLLKAAKHGHFAVVNRLLDIHAFRQAAAARNKVLYWAAFYNDLDVVNRLLEIDAVRQVLNYYENTALWCAAERGHLAVVNRLLEIDATIRYPHKYWYCGSIAVHSAAENGHLEVVRRLLEIVPIRKCAAPRNLNLPFGIDLFYEILKLSVGLVYEKVETIETVIERLAEKYPRLKTSIEKEKRKNEATAFLVAYNALRKRHPESPLKKYGCKDMAVLIAKMVKNSPPPAEQPEGLSSKKARVL
ncbi:MAG: ankyrin repeat domain-containing protein [Proteobacteria bacterium]|nr:ankyrin repeat domain-containing protein [Pseudomonadota bacterium]